jgi:Z1 domain-containing protein
MPGGIDLAKFKTKAQLKDRYAKQLQRLHDQGIAPACIEEAVKGATDNLAKTRSSSLVIYGEPQSGKTEMMICLTAKLLDVGNRIIVHLMNDSVDLLAQNLTRFKASGLAPAPRSLSDLLQSSPTQSPKELVVFCKKNVFDLDKLIARLAGKGKVVVIDDEADYATPNAKVNQGTKTKVNDRIGKLLGADGSYVGVTATPARLDLNNTFKNDTAKWVNFPPHSQYTGQDIFFPLDKRVPYRLTLLDKGGSPKEAQDAFVRFLVTVAYLNLYENDGKEENYTMLVHTSGRKLDHELDRVTMESSVQALIDSDSSDFDSLVTQVHSAAQKLYPTRDADHITNYVVTNASRATSVVLNSKRDRKTAGENATQPSSPFTIIIGGNIVSRGVTFPNLLSMFFTRNVKHKLQQDTYIQRARMFGARGKYLKHFELTIPTQLYADWHRCFVLHKLALETINNKLGSPVWIGDNRVSVAAKSSIDNATVVLDRGEMSFGVFNFSTDLDAIVLEDQTSTDTLKKLQTRIGKEALPGFLIEYIRATSTGGPGLLAIHSASSIVGSRDANQAAISRDKGFMGKSQLEPKRFTNAVHHVKIFYNKKGKARLFYKFQGNLQFIQNLRGTA